MVKPFQPHRWQETAADDYERLGGVFIGLDPGAGKTYAFSQIARRCRRPLVVAPAAAVHQTMAQFWSYGVPCFEAKNKPAAPPPAGAVAFASYTWLTRAEQAEFFERYQPTDVLMDEFHVARGLANSARKRLERYLIANPAVRVAISTASPMSGALHDFAFGLHWALRSGVRGLVPQLRSGVDALDARLQADPAAREAFRARLQATPGVYLDVGDVGRYLGAVQLRVVRQAPALELPDTWETPSGFLVESPAHAAQVERQLAWGYYYDTDPRPSPAYVAARRRWGATVQRAVAQGLADTEFQVRALRPEEYAVWAAAQAAEGPLAEPVAQWASTESLNWIATWLDEKHPSCGFGDRLRRLKAAGSMGPGPTDSDTADSWSAVSELQPTDIPGLCTTDPYRQAWKSVTAAITGGACGQTICSSAPISTTCSTQPKKDACESSENESRTIIWVSHVALGLALSSALGVPYHREGGCDAAGTRLDEARCPLVVASIDACFQAFNAQWFNSMLFLECPADPETWKQAIGRAARQGQTAPRVTCDIVVNCRAAERALRSAVERAKVVYELTGKKNPLLSLKGNW